MSKKCINDYKTACLKTHNYYRSLHSVPPLTRSAKLDRMAQSYSEQLADNDLFLHSNKKGYGENLAYSWSSKSPNLRDCASIFFKFKFIQETNYKQCQKRYCQ